MRIILTMLDKQFGGMQKAFLNYAIEFTKSHFQVLCIVRQGAEAERLLHETGITSVASIKNQFGFHDPVAIRQIATLIGKHCPPPDRCIVMVFGARATFFSGKAKTRQPQCKVVASLPNRINHKYYKFADALVPSTRKMADPSYHRNLVNPNFTEVIPRFSRIQSATVITPRNRISNLFAAGRFVSKKGFNHLLEAVSRLSPDNPDIRLTIAGDGPELNRLLEMRSELGLDSIVEFIGFRYDVPDLIARSDLLIVPSKIEPFGNILLEGMAAGTPIVTTRNDGALELLDPSTARFADKGSPESLASAISDVIEDPHSANERAVRALQAFKQRYTRDVVVPKMLSVFRQLH